MNFKNSNITKMTSMRCLTIAFLASNLSFGQEPQKPDRTTYGTKESIQAISIISNSDGSQSANEYIYLRSGQDNDSRWFKSAQLIVADDWIGARRPLRFLAKDDSRWGGNNGWYGSGEYIENSYGHTEAKRYGLGFFTGNDLAMSITNEQRVGIGTRNPLHIFDVFKDEGVIAGFGQQFGSKVQIWGGHGPSKLNGIGTTSSADDFYLLSSESKRMVIKNDGKVGIGTDTPEHMFDVYKDEGVVAGFGKQFGAKVYIYGGKGTTETTDFNGIGTRTDHDFHLLANNSEKLVVKPDGKVGIGTNNPTKKLDVAGDINFTGDLYKDGVIYQPRSTNNERFETIETTDKILFLDENGGRGMGEEYITNTHNLDGKTEWGLSFFSGNLNAMTIQSNQRIGIGTDNPTKKLDVAGDINFSGDLYKNGVLFGGVNGGFGGVNGDDVKLGTDAGKDIVAPGSHVFIGHQAGTLESFNEIEIIDFKDPDNTNKFTGPEYLQEHSVLVINNHNDLKKPLMFGHFADPDVSDSMAQLAINTHHIVKDVALTVSGAVHIGSKDLDPIVFPSQEGYDDALLWVERGIVTEDLTLAFLSDWDSWPDYVFEKEYELMELDKLDEYIRKEKHLPGIISMEDVKEKGLHTKEFVTNLLLKIEELTLYTISQEKKIETQKQNNQTLLERITAIEEQLKN